MASIQPLARPNYIKQNRPQQVRESQYSESKPTKWERIEDLFRKVTDLIEVDTTDTGDIVFERRVSDYAISKGFSIKRFIVPKYGTWIVEQKLCYRGREVNAMKPWEIELLFLEL